MTQEPSRSIRLFGTDEAVAPPRLLSAGPLTAELEAGNLRYIRWHGIEVMRAISFIVRDRDWGTYNPEISDLEVAEAPGRFTRPLPGADRRRGAGLPSTRPRSWARPPAA